MQNNKYFYHCYHAFTYPLIVFSRMDFETINIEFKEYYKKSVYFLSLSNLNIVRSAKYFQLGNTFL